MISPDFNSDIFISLPSSLLTTIVENTYNVSMDSLRRK
jgi:hypothetical protein